MRYDIKKFVFKNIGFFLIAVVSALYIVKGLYTLDQSGKTVMQIIGDGALSAAVGFIIGHLMRQTGISYGGDDIEVIKIKSLHSRLLDRAAPYANRLDSFCEEENKRSCELIRRRILSRGGVSYESCFTPEGEALLPVIEINKGLPRSERKHLKMKRKAIKRATEIRLTPLTPESLSVDGAKYADPYDFGKTEGQYLRGRGGRDMLSKILFGFLFGYYAIYLTENASMESIVWASLQIAIYLIFGATQMMQAYMFVKTECAQRITRKIDVLQRFLNKFDTKNKDTVSKINDTVL